MKSDNMDMQKHELEYGFGLIMNHLTDSPSDDLLRQLNAWRSCSEENDQLFVWMEQMWHALTLSNYDQTFNQQRAYLLFCEHIKAKTDIARHSNFSIPNNKFLKTNKIWRPALYAAVLASLIVFSYFTYNSLPVSPVETLLHAEINVPNGSKTQISLQDGTKVWLNSDSHIRYDSEFGRANRTLTLSGEAYFEVAKNEQSPFIVIVGDIKIKVHGTHFNVNSYKENNGVSVALLEGSVEMITGKGNTTLQPGHLAHYDAVTGNIDVQIESAQQADNMEYSNNSEEKNDAINLTEEAVAWVDNRLIFNGETFEQIISVLERRYNVKVNIQNDQIRKRHFAGDFTNNETIEQIFKVMSVNGNFRYQFNGNIIDIN